MNFNSCDNFHVCFMYYKLESRLIWNLCEQILLMKDTKGNKLYVWIKIFKIIEIDVNSLNVQTWPLLHSFIILYIYKTQTS